MQTGRVVQKKKNKIPSFSEIKLFVISELNNKLSPELTYHSVDHTLDVLNCCNEIASNEDVTDEQDLLLLRLSALYHDIGYTVTYKRHEENSVILAREQLANYGFAPDQIETICDMIMATKIGIEPKTKLQEILCDADLDYLGRKDYYPIARNLFIEFKNFDIVRKEADWKDLQLKFLKNHSYYTAFSKKVREPNKRRIISELADE
ncbi:MAG: HD domain-containing protein [Candidatus Cyclobacteriaceae bacterium M2_1C_046]